MFDAVNKLITWSGVIDVPARVPAIDVMRRAWATPQPTPHVNCATLGSLLLADLTDDLTRSWT
jgi:hypothetical protein